MKSRGKLHFCVSLIAGLFSLNQTGLSFLTPNQTSFKSPPPPLLEVSITLNPIHQIKPNLSSSPGSKRDFSTVATSLTIQLVAGAKRSHKRINIDASARSAGSHFSFPTFQNLHYWFWFLCFDNTIKVDCSSGRGDSAGRQKRKKTWGEKEEED